MKRTEDELSNIKKLGNQVPPELTTRMRHTITSVSGETDKQKIYSFVDNMLSRDSLALRKEIVRITPDIDMTQDIDIGGDTVTVTIPMTVGFFWPDIQS